MNIPSNVIGIDVAKRHLDIFDTSSSRLHHIDNTAEAIDGLLDTWQAGDRFVVFEATGRYDRRLTRALEGRGIAHARVNPAHARSFARACGQLAKTDRLDARVLADMGRRMPMRADKQTCENRRKLADLTSRRDQLVAMRAQEKTRQAEDVCPRIKQEMQEHIDHLDRLVADYNRRIGTLIAETEELAEQASLMQSVPGIGPVATMTLLALMPELGNRPRRAIAALAGVAPINNDTGQYRGRRSIRGGRARVRKALYMAAVSAVRSDDRFKAKYESLRGKGKSAKVAFIAIARQILVTLNAMLRDRKPFQKQNA